MTIYEDDQSKAATVVVINGTHASMSATQLKGCSTAGTVYTFTASYRHTFSGRHLDYRKGMSYALDAKLRSELLALGAPMVAA